jgi:hypothetical protein
MIPVAGRIARAAADFPANSGRNRIFGGGFSRRGGDTIAAAPQ